MEHYQQTMVNIMTRRVFPQQPSDSSLITCTKSDTTTLTCPAGTVQDPSYLTIPFTVPSEENTNAKEPKRPKEQQANKFLAGTDMHLCIGTSTDCAVTVTEILNRSVVTSADSDVLYVSSSRWWWRTCNFPTRWPGGRLHRELWHVWEHTTVQATFQDPIPGSMGHPELYFLFAPHYPPVNYSANLHLFMTFYQWWLRMLFIGIQTFV